MISVIVLALNEEARLPACLAALAGQAPHELLVVDGGSTDRTVASARAAGARVIVSEPGRAVRPNRGASDAAGDVLLFVHADTRLAPGALELVEQTLAADPGIVGGSFTLRFDRPGAVLRLFEILGDLYHCVSTSLYGDRGIFVRRGAFGALQGFRPLPFMEEYDLGRRLPRLGRVCILHRPVVTSAREFESQGPLIHGRQTLSLPGRLSDGRSTAAPAALLLRPRRARPPRARRRRSAAGAGLLPAAKGAA